MKEYIIFDYLYRDASNYKAHGSLLLEGSLNMDTKVLLESYLDCGQFFIPEYAGIPALQTGLYRFGGRNTDDHDYHEFVSFRKPDAEELETMNPWGSVEALLAALKTASARWLFDGGE